MIRSSVSSIIAGVGGNARRVGVVRFRGAALLADAVDEASHLTQAIEIQQGWGTHRGIEIRHGGVVRPAHSKGRVEAVRESDDEVRIDTPTDLDDLHLLAVERMIRVDNRHESQTSLG
jgi:hypothetical protein